VDGKSLREFCLQQTQDHLLREWDRENNAGLTPDRVTAHSGRRVWWVCPHGHRWQAAIKDRVQGKGCPVCSHKRLVPGVNDLATTHPVLAAQWHPTKNAPLTPGDVVSGHHRKVWWICDKGHEWQAQIYSRAHGAGCPVCAGKTVVPGENDLASRFPDLAAQWHGEKNGALTPQAVGAYSNRQVWWTCEQGHAYRSTVAHRTRMGSGCPYCAGRKVLPGFNDLATTDPKLTAQWHPELNGDLTPQRVTRGSKKKVWWQCSFGHVWKAAVFSRTGKRPTGCPVCAGKGKERIPPGETPRFE